MANIKEYKIIINGLDVSINAVDSLNKQLDALEKRINNLQGKTLNVSTKTTSSNTGALNEEDKLLKQIRQTEEKIATVRTENYQRLLAEKDLLKEATNDQKQRAANERLIADTYSNTMEGLKQNLADIKTVMQTTDLGDDEFKKLTENAKALTDRLKEIEQSYGTFSRNVGNYSSAFDSLKGVTISVGDTTREFSSSREALKTLSEELKTLSINGQANTEEANNLREAYNQLKSAIDDATISSKAMDEAMDWMASFTAAANVGEGIKSFFGIDNSEMLESIKNLQALQSTLQGIESLRKQMDTEEGFGKYFKKGNAAVDGFVNKLFGVRKAVTDAKTSEEQLATATNQIATSSKAATTAEAGQTVATVGLTTSMTVATVAARALGTALKAIGIGIILEALSLLIDGIKAVGGAIIDAFSTGEQQIQKVDDAINGLNYGISRQIEALNNLYDSGIITKAEYLTEQYRLQAKYINDTIDAIRRRQMIDDGESNFGNQVTGSTRFKEADFVSRLTRSTLYINAEDIQELRGEFRKLNDAIENGEDYLTRYGDSLSDWYKSFFVTVSDTKDIEEEVGQAIVNDFLGRIQDATNEYSLAMIDLKNGVDGAADRVKAAESTIKSLEGELNNDDIIHSIIANLDEYIPDEKVREACQNIIASLDAVKQAMDADETAVRRYFEDLSIRMLPQFEQSIARLNQKRQEDLNNYGRTEEQRLKINQYYDKEIQEEQDKHNKSLREKGQKHNRQTMEAEQDLQNWIINNMQNGLQKQLAQLQNEQNQKLAKVRQTGILVREREQEINQYYDRRREQMVQEHTHRVEDAYKRMWQNIYTYTNQTTRLIQEVFDSTSEGVLNDIDKRFDQLYNQGISSYSDLSFTLDGVFDKDLLDATKKLVDMQRELQVLQNGQIQMANQASLTTGTVKEEYERMVDVLEEMIDRATESFEQYKEEIIQTYSRASVEAAQHALIEKNYTSDISAILNQRLTVLQTYWDTRLANIKVQEEQEKQLQITLEDERYAEAYRQNEDWYEEQQRLQRKNLEDGLITQEQYEALSARTYDEYITRSERLTEEHVAKMQEIERNQHNRSLENTKEYYNQMLQELRDFNTALANEERKQPVMNAWGITNLKQTNKNNRQLLRGYQSQLDYVGTLRQSLQTSFDDGLIDRQTFQQYSRELDSLVETTAEKMKKVKHELSLAGQIEQLVDGINQYAQVLGQSLQTLFQAFDDYADYKLEKEQDALQKQSEMLQKELDKQSDIIEKHSSEVNSIEDELSSARGDRRQHLIDQLNAEIQAQREAEKEKQRIEKEQEALEKKQEALEKKRKQEEYERNLRNILVSGAMAAANGLATQPFWPVGVAMGALATSLAAVQYALAKKQKPYANGGLLEGPSHKNGGIPVGNTGIVVEGNEYVINKRTTSYNEPLLDYINSSRKRLTLSDFIDFYEEEPKKTIKNIRKTTFADGGVISTSNIDLNSALDRTIVIKDDSVYQVSVVDINRQQANLKNIQVLAGLK